MSVDDRTADSDEVLRWLVVTGLARDALANQFPDLLAYLESLHPARPSPM